MLRREIAVRTCVCPPMMEKHMKEIDKLLNEMEEVYTNIRTLRINMERQLLTMK